MRYFIRLIGRLLLYFILLLLFLVAIQYATCPIYDFPEPEPFSGDKIYNPYENLDQNDWYLGNFQIQAKAWGGITDGRKNSSEYVYEIYGKIGYTAIGISDYQKINKYGIRFDSYIPVYEHGYGVKKNHQVLLGSRKVLWRDYPFGQNINHKQHILNLLRKNNDLVYIAHPYFVHGYAPDDMRLLTNYDGIEVLNGFRISIDHWDAALSSGKYVTILSDDDAHDISNLDEVGRFSTMISAAKPKGELMVLSLQRGNSFGADLARPPGETLGEKAERIKNLPVLQNVDLNNDTLFVKVSKQASEIRFVGQEGKVLKTTNNRSSASYMFEPKDSYIRVEIIFPDQVRYLLNPLVRYHDNNPFDSNTATVNKFKTSVQRLLFALFVFVLIIYLRRRRRRKK